MRRKLTWSIKGMYGAAVCASLMFSATQLGATPQEICDNFCKSRGYDHGMYVVTTGECICYND